MKAMQYRLGMRLTTDLADFRQTFAEYAASFQSLVARRQELATPFMALCRRWQRETGRRSFLAFVQALDATVPADRERYMHHRSYQVARYLQRLSDAPETRAGARPRGSLTPLDLSAALLRTLLPLADGEDALWRAVAARTRWHARDLDRLRDRARQAKPLAVPLAGVPRLRKRASAPPAVAVAADAAAMN